MKRLFAVLLMAALLPGCATKVEGLFVKDDFRAPEIKRGGMVVGGVIGEPGKFDLQRSNEFSSVMLAAFQNERKYINTAPQGVLFNALGEKGYTDLMSSFIKADLDQSALGLVASKVKDIRYLALAKVDVNATEKGASENQPYEYKDKSGKVVKEPGRMIRTQKRQMVVTMTIYDIQSRSVAFSGHVTKSREARSEYVKEKSPVALQVVKALVSDGSDEYATPEAPQTRDVIRDIFVGFAQNLPKPD